MGELVTAEALHVSKESLKRGELFISALFQMRTSMIEAEVEASGLEYNFRFSKEALLVIPRCPLDRVLEGFKYHKGSSTLVEDQSTDPFFLSTVQVHGIGSRPLNKESEITQPHALSLYGESNSFTYPDQRVAHLANYVYNFDPTAHTIAIVRSPQTVTVAPPLEIQG